MVNFVCYNSIVVIAFKNLYSLDKYWSIYGWNDTLKECSFKKENKNGKMLIRLISYIIFLAFVYVSIAP